MELEEQKNIFQPNAHSLGDESCDREFKSAKGGLPKSIWESYSGMANANGGTIYLGIEDDGSVSGLADVGKMKKTFWDAINNRGNVSINLLKDTDVEEKKHPNGTVLAIHVPRASRYQRPVYVGQNPMTGTYKRNHEGDYRCTEQEVSRMLIDRSEEPADSRIIHHSRMGDLDLQSFHQYRQLLASHKPTHPWLKEDDQKLLAKLGGWRDCKEPAQKGLTVAGLLMFGCEDSLRSFLPQYSVDFREKLSNNPEVRWTDRVMLDGTWPGNLFQFYLLVFPKLCAGLKLPFQLDANLLRKGETVVHEAIREALINALIHTDYLGQGGIVIEKYKDRFEFSNPGTLLISLEQMLQGNVSECRNKSLQTMFTMIGAAEKAGSGIDKIRRGWDSQCWRSPAIRENVQPDRIVLSLSMISLLPEESLDRLKARFGTKFPKFTPLQMQALVTADLEGWVDNARMRQITLKHSADVTKLLQDLVSQEALVQDRYGRWARYRLPFLLDSLHMNSDSVHTPINHLNNSALQEINNSAHMNPDSLHMTSNTLTSSQLQKNNDSLHMVSDSLHMNSNQLTSRSLRKKDDPQYTHSRLHEEVNSELKKIAEPARQNRHLSPKATEAILLELCKNRWMTRRQIAELLDRNEDGLRTRFLTPMVEHGLLRLRYPEKPNRADQAYTTKKTIKRRLRIEMQ